MIREVKIDRSQSVCACARRGQRLPPAAPDGLGGGRDAALYDHSAAHRRSVDYAEIAERAGLCIAYCLSLQSAAVVPRSSTSKEPYSSLPARS
jgi:hypothetical protein